MYKKLFITLMCLVAQFTQGEALNNSQRLRPLQAVTEIPETSIRALKKSFSKEAMWPWVGILGSTALLYHYDAEIYQEGQAAGRNLGIGNADNTRTVVKAGQYDLLRLPSDTGSALYFLGDGWLHGSIAAGFLSAGYFGNYDRPFNTGIQLVHGMIVSTIFSQGIKHATGRESPSERTTPSGAWRPFPSFNAYNSNTPKYDAFPSGHVMTATLTFTVIAENYPEYNYLTYPLAGTWLALLSYQMVNNGVHWASDYPLGIAMGYLFGKLSAQIGKPETKSSGQEKSESKWLIFPSSWDQTQTVNVLYVL